MFISVKYVDIERELEQDFEAAHVRNDTHYMKTCADALLPFNRVRLFVLLPDDEVHCSAFISPPGL